MRTITFFIILFTVHNIVEGQSIYEKLYQSGTSYSFNLIELPGHKLLTPMGATLLLNAEGDVEHASFFRTFPYHLDTLHSDYAFIIATSLVKNLFLPSDSLVSLIGPKWDFILFPNPTRDDLFLKFSNDSPKEILLQDLSGRHIQNWSSETGLQIHLKVKGLAKGAYYLRVSDGMNSTTKKLIIQ